MKRPVVQEDVTAVNTRLLHALLDLEEVVYYLFADCPPGVKQSWMVLDAIRIRERLEIER